MKEDCFRMSVEHCAKSPLALVLPLNADQTFDLFPKPFFFYFFFYNAADSIHVPLNNVFIYSSINKSIIRTHNQC